MYIISSKIKLKKLLLILFSILLISGAVFFVMYCNKKISISAEENKKFIKYVEFNPNYKILKEAMNEDIKSHNSNQDVKIDWIRILAYLATKYGGKFDKYKNNDIKNYVEKVKNGENPEQSLENQKLFNYYLDAYGTILKDFLGEFEYKNKNGKTVKTYGLKARCPIAKGYPFHH